MNTAAKGRRGEHRARKLLEEAGFSVCRAAASKGPADLVAWNPSVVRFVSVKSGTGRMTPLERATLLGMDRPPNSTVELWTFRDRRPTPEIERL